MMVEPSALRVLLAGHRACVWALHLRHGSAQQVSGTLTWLATIRSPQGHIGSWMPAEVNAGRAMQPPPAPMRSAACNDHSPHCHAVLSRPHWRGTPMCNWRTSTSSWPKASPGRVASRWLPRVTYCTSRLPTALYDFAANSRRPVGILDAWVSTDTVLDDMRSPAAGTPHLVRLGSSRGRSLIEVPRQASAHGMTNVCNPRWSGTTPGSKQQRERLQASLMWQVCPPGLQLATGGLWAAIFRA